MTDEKPNDDKAFTGLISQEDAQYVALSNTPGQACANCRWFKPYGDYCHLVEDYPEPILATGHSNRWEAVPVAVIPEVEPLLVQIVEPPLTMDDSAEMSLSVPKGIVQRVKEFVDGLRPEPKQQAFMVFKAANGRNAWLSRHTGKFIDRENEILSEKSHDEYVERVQKGIVAMPELWMWHAKGTRHGQAVAVWKSGGFVLAAGLFDDNAIGQRAFDYYHKNSGKIKLSHMFHFPHETKVNGVYHAYNTVEITTLPDGAEAFPYTSFEEIQTMALPEVARNMIGAALGEDVLQRAIAADSKAESDTKALESQGVAFKGYDNYDGTNLLPAQKVTALETAQSTNEKRLQLAEETLKALAALPETVTALKDTVKSLGDQLDVEIQAKNTALEKINELESKLALFSDLKPPASQSSETLLSDREKSLVESAVKQANVEGVSYIEKLLGATPTVS